MTKSTIWVKKAGRSRSTETSKGYGLQKPLWATSYPAVGHYITEERFACLGYDANECAGSEPLFVVSRWSQPFPPICRFYFLGIKPFKKRHRIIHVDSRCS